MRKLIPFIFLGLATLVFSCKGEQVDTLEAARAAKEYYDTLLAGHAATFVGGMYLPDSIPDSYRQQLEANAKMFVARQQEEHGGICDVKILNCVNDSAAPTANAFLLLTFGDSLREEIVVGMVKHQGRWLMR